MAVDAELARSSSEAKVDNAAGDAAGKKEDSVANAEKVEKQSEADTTHEKRTELPESDIDPPALSPELAVVMSPSESNAPPTPPPHEIDAEADHTTPKLPSRRKKSVPKVEDAVIDDTAFETASIASASSLASDSNGPAKQQRSQRNLGITGMLPNMPWATPTSPAGINTQQPLPVSIPPPPPSRKISSPFSWLSRAKEQPPPLPVRTTSSGSKLDSASTVQNSPELSMSKIAGRPRSNSPAGRETLRDRFKELRLRGEGVIVDENVPIAADGSALAGLISRSSGLGLSIASPTSLDDKDDAKSPETQVPPVRRPSVVDSNVDWDLWQEVVYEGPAAVARRSPEELNRAIAAGIPSAIRGVVWQVMAQSKNEDLEGVYRELVARGTSDEERRHSASSVASSAAQSRAETNGKDSPSEVSSIYSAVSSPTEGNGKVFDPMDVDAEALSKEQAAKAEKRRQRAKEDKAAIQKLERAIKRDLGARTSYSKYAVAAGLQDGLFGVCKAYALFDEPVGYAQGMNFLAMPLLFNMTEDEAFCMLVKLMNQYGLRELFIDDMPGLHLHLYQFERLLEDLEPALYCHLHRRHVSPQLYATQWFLTLFAYRFPLQLVLRVYDLILSEGLEGAILKFGIVLMQRNRDALLAMNDMATLTTFLKEKLFDVYIDRNPSSASLLESGFFGSSGGSDKEVYRADEMVQDACAVKITPQMLKAYATEWEEKNRLEKERELEIETLRVTNLKITAQLRALQNHAEKLEMEHVSVASDLVKHKVENEELKDQNESLTGQVTELRAVVEKQTADVYEKLKGEMETVMKRNLEVHNSNQQLETAMGEMEKDLVNTKIQLAEISEKHDALKLRWSDLRKVLED